MYAKANPVSSKYGGAEDILTPYKDLLILDRDGTGLVAYNIPSGTEEWKIPVPSGRGSIDKLYGSIFSGMKLTGNQPEKSSVKKL